MSEEPETELSLSGTSQAGCSFESEEDTTLISESVLQGGLLDWKSLIRLGCCENLCFNHGGKGDLEKIQQQDVEEVRSIIKPFKRDQKLQYLLDYMATHSSFSTETNKWTFTYSCGTTQICSTAWMALTGISESTLFRLKKRVKGGRISVAPSSSRQNTMLPKSHDTLAWLDRFASEHGDKLPLPSFDMDKYHLPSSYTKKDVYSLMKESAKDHQQECCSESHFYKLWREHAKHIAIPPVNRFSKCDKCTYLKSELEKTRNRFEREQLRETRDKHLKQQSYERKKYYKHIQKAKDNPSRYTSIIIDGMDQQKTNIPHFVIDPKAASGMWKLRCHVTGVIMHGLAVHGYFDVGEYPHGSNLTATVLVNSLYLMREALGRVLYLQLDNCGRENKNVYVFALCSLLVELGIFDKIKVSFLMVGHTHEDIDQLFSRYSIYLKKNNAKTMDALLDSFEKCYTPNPQSIRMEHLFDVKEWLTGHYRTMENHSLPHVFKMYRNASGKCAISVKKWSTDTEWIQSKFTDDNTGPYVFQTLPQGTPDLEFPNYGKLELDKLHASLKKVYRYMSDDEKQWWRSWIRAADNKLHERNWDSDGGLHWLLPQIVQYVRNKPTVEQDHGAIDIDISDEDEPLSKYVKIGKVTRKRTQQK